MLMKTYVYYGIDQNRFEIRKYNPANPYAEVEGILGETYFKPNEIEPVIFQMACDFTRDGFAIYEAKKVQGLRIIVGIARHGKCSEITKRFAELRKEAKRH